MDNFWELPDELILKILGYLEHSDLKNCLCVCQRWYRLGNDDSLWHKVEMALCKLSLVTSLARQHPNIHSLLILSRSQFRHVSWDLSMIPVSDWGLFRNLTNLTLYACPEHFFNALPFIFSACHETLTCFCCDGSATLESEQFQLLFTNPLMQFRELSIAHCPLIGDLAIFQAQRGLHFSTCLEKLELLNLYGTGTVERLTDVGIVVFLTACPILKSLSCDGEFMTDESSKHIQKLSRLEHLSISFCTELTDESLDCFSKLKNLTSLQLRKGNEFTNQGFELLFDNLCSQEDCHARKLKNLCLVECKLLRDSGLIRLAQRFPNLVHLDLSWCWNLSDIGLEAVAHHCHKIETLKLVGLKNAMCVPVLSTSLPKLRLLDLEQTDLVNDEDLKKLKEIKPWIKITDYYGEEVGGEM